MTSSKPSKQADKAEKTEQPAKQEDLVEEVVPNAIERTWAGRALPHYEGACEAIAKARDEVLAFRDQAKQVRAETRRGPPNREQEKVATETWVRAEDRLNEMTSVLSKTVSAAKMAAGLLVDPEAAEVHWAWGDISDPYAVALDPENRTIGRLYFARTPGGDHWICSYDLPEATRDALRKRGERGDFDREDDLPFDSL